MRGNCRICLSTIAVLTMLSMSRLVGAAAPSVPAPAGQSWAQTFSNDFSSPDATLDGWTYMLGTGSQYGQTGWGNNELQTYTADPSNVNISGGALNITARVENNATNITSARITTENLFSQTYGLFQFTARLPEGSALWPAFWLLPKSPVANSKPGTGVYGGFPTSGEIDVMESGLGNSLPSNSQIQGSVHSGVDSANTQSHTAFYNTSNDPSFDTTNLNTYSLLWQAGPDANTPGTLQWFVNGELYGTQSGGWYNPPGATTATAPFDQPFYLVMNLAVGGPDTPYTGGQLPVDGTYTMQITDVSVFSAVPEPSSMALAGIAVAALSASVLRKKLKRLRGCDNSPVIPV